MTKRLRETSILFPSLFFLILLVHPFSRARHEYTKNSQDKQEKLKKIRWREIIEAFDKGKEKETTMLY